MLKLPTFPPFLRLFSYGLIAGLPFTLIHYPYPWWALTFLGFSLFFKEKEGVTKPKTLFFYGWCFGVGLHVAALYWVVMALKVDWVKFAPLVPLAIFGIPAYLSLFLGLNSLISGALFKTKHLKLLAFALFFCLFEWVRGHYFLAFPWDLLGYIWVSHDWMIQTVSVIGIYGLSLLTTALILLPCFAKRVVWSSVYAALLVFSFIPYPYKPLQHHEDLSVHIVQPDLLQSEKWNRNHMFQHYQKVLKLAQHDASTSKTIIVTPESSADFLFSRVHGADRHTMSKIQDGDLILVGTMRHEIPPFTIWNSLYSITTKGVQDIYDKAVLLPFGEYVPYRKFLPSFIAKVTAGDLDFTPGKARKTVSVQGYPSFTPLICSEGMFAGDVIPKERPDFLVSLTNDAWFGLTSGPFQHFQITRVRAIEEGLPLVRAANTGVSGLVGPQGQVLKRLPFETVDTLTVPLPKAFAPTFFARYPHWLFWGMWLVLFILLIGFQIRSYKCKS